VLPVLLDPLAQVGLHPAHGQKQSSLRLAGGVDGHDACVLEAGRDPRLAQEPLAEPGVTGQVGIPSQRLANRPPVNPGDPRWR
jgi:hypothetical protein